MVKGRREIEKNWENETLHSTREGGTLTTLTETRTLVAICARSVYSVIVTYVYIMATVKLSQC